MIDKLKEIKKLRKTRKLVAEEELKRLEKDYELLISLAKVRPAGYVFSIDEKGLSDDEFEHRMEKIARRMEKIFDDIGIEYKKELQPKENFKRKTNQLEKDLEKLINLADNFKQKSQPIF
ncbi:MULTISPECIES: hypothetical protein [Psychrilyobacter]|uniref:Uncharacterized protein n=1 Tax=Psychrilyobacter piezotolerans TaxID=2293438 RepID=A0ABX9KGT1_9FUSO|nr:MULTISPECIES: hypothetical protein [Psychrilyobacter]MCS5420725.1 hypothetical protein [Psychrilyobacter sp. S5]NDI77999.1 hypothetical protein [Psychrilyobacter piezotolerans]RDE61942.1 hypothetical protein DV867_08065 [Psychrilyobacter sp. S5]REI41168.1 hypothetical protein DYH56_08065 [Psychrilyobacter piezotolerans]